MINEENKNETDVTLPPLMDRYVPGMTNSLPGINSPEISLPAFNPPVPNRAWTAMRNGADIEDLTDEERDELYLGNDNYL